MFCADLVFLFVLTFYVYPPLFVVAFRNLSFRNVFIHLNLCLFSLGGIGVFVESFTAAALVKATA